MRVAVIGQAAFAAKALDALKSRGEEIVHVFAPPDAPSGKPDPLKARALELGVPLSQPRSFKSDEVYGQFRALDADLAVLAFVTLIVPERILYAPRLSAICFHPSLLPRHRGASAVNWALIHGDTETGITWFWPDRGIDTGPVLLQRAVAVAPDDTTGSLYFNRLFPLGIETLVEAVDLIKCGKAPRIQQDESRATYEPPCRDEHARADFSRTASEVYNLVRGCDPQPGGFAVLGEARLRLYDVRLEAQISKEAAGTVIAIDEAAMRIALNGATMAVRKVRLEPSAGKMAPRQLAEKGLLEVGNRLA